MVRRKILIVRLSAIGDILFCLPALSALREIFPKAEISWLVEDRASALVVDHPDLKEVFVYPRRKWQKGILRPASFFATVREALSFFKVLRREKYDTIIDFQGNLKSGIFLLFSRGVEKIGLARGYCKELNFLFTNRHVTPPKWPLHRVEKDLSLLEPLGVPMKKYPVSLYLSEEEEEFGRRFERSLPRRGVPRLILHPGTSAFGKFKRWPVDRFAALGTKARESLGTTVIVTWGPGEKEIAEKVVSLMKGDALLAPQTHSLKMLASIIKRCHCFLSADTGPLHLAALLGVPVIGLYGPKNPDIYGPYTEKKWIFRQDLPCSPCSKRSCRRPVCMEGISVDTVFQALKKSLSPQNASN